MANPLTTAQRTEFLGLSTLEQQFAYVAQALMTLQSLANQAQPSAAQYIQLVPSLNTALLYVSVKLPLVQDAIVQFPPQAVLEVFAGMGLAPTTTPTPVPTPTPTPSNSAAGVVYVPSQSISSYVTATYEQLTNSDIYTGALCYYASTGFIQATFPHAVDVSSVTVGGGFLPAFGGYIVQDAGLNGAKLQYSTDNANWVDVWTVVGATDAGATQFVTHSITPAITAQYWRLTGVPYVATSKFRFT